ncbi:MAG: non-heme iron oxygenase ferredoxin subunit [Alphaproteobacteria bacterium]|nr:non-heme iron oxygenase ferredoxin subunit [Alphaproteobacteria bacterium]
MDGVIKIEVPGRPPLAAFNLDGTFYVTDDTCTHGEASLSEGVIEDGLIECPFHQGCFEIATGRPAAAPCTVPIRAYRPVIERDLLHIEDDGA